MATKTNQKLNSEVKEKVLQFGRVLIKKGIPITKLLIFGSYAKNTASKYSDIDVCVVSPKFGIDAIDEMQYLFHQRREIDSRIEPYPASPSEYRKMESPIMFEIRKFGLEVSGLL